MNYAENNYANLPGMFAAQADADERSDFITKTYLHLAGAVGLFVIVEALLQSLPGIQGIAQWMMGVQTTADGQTTTSGQYHWLIVLGLFMFVSYLAENWARSAVSLGTQYAGLALYVVAEAVIFIPLIYIALAIQPGIIVSAGLATLLLFVGMTAIVFITRKDFSFLSTYLYFGGFAALGLIVVSILFKFAMGPIFTYAMIALACGYILFHTSAVLHQYRIGQHVAAALALFASVALLFWYVLQLFLSRRN
jgi:FtsH-binding integral membrane protein